MARANTKVTEEVLNDEVMEGDVEESVAPVEEVSEEKPNRVEVVMPKYLFTTDPDEEHHEVCVGGRIYQVRYDEPVKVPPVVADVINNAIAQKKKVRSLIKSMSGKAKEIQ